MERFLSPAWFARFAGEEQPGAEQPGATADLVLAQVVTDTPYGNVRYQVRIVDGEATILEGSPAEADMTFTSDYKTAAAIAAGSVSTEAALAAGRMRVAGDLARLQDRAGLLRSLDPLGAAGRAATSFNPPAREPPPDPERPEENHAKEKAAADAAGQALRSRWES